MPWNEALERSPGSEALAGREGWGNASDAAAPRYSPTAHAEPALQLRPVSPAMGIEASGIDLSEDISARDFDRLYAAWLETGLLILRNQALSPAQQIAFTRRFGEILVYTRSENAHPDHPELLILSNVVRDGRPCGQAVSGRYWHTDGHYLRRPPSACLLHGVIIPSTGGDTWFSNMSLAYEALPQVTKDHIEGRRVIISRVRSIPYNYPGRAPATEEQRAAWLDMDQPMVRTHPETGRKALYVGGNVPWFVEGMDEAEGMSLVTTLQNHAVEDRFVHVHRWQRGDLLIWDNRSALHRATAYDQSREQRHMHRTSVVGEIPA